MHYFLKKMPFYLSPRAAAKALRTLFAYNFTQNPCSPSLEVLWSKEVNGTYCVIGSLVSGATVTFVCSRMLFPSYSTRPDSQHLSSYIVISACSGEQANYAQDYFMVVRANFMKGGVTKIGKY